MPPKHQNCSRQRKLDDAPAPAHPRQLGRSRVYTPEDLPDRLVHWHSPRVNRWERLCIIGGALTIERLGAAGTTVESLPSGEARWIAPGVRWRVAEAPPGTRFELEVHADTLGQAEAPQTLRSELLDEAERVAVADPVALLAQVDALVPGERRLIEASFSADGNIAAMLRDERIFWHPLEVGSGRFSVLVARSDHAFDLAEYLGRDHAVIEATLAGALRGDAEYRRWLDSTLARHLAMEEALIFPAYEAAGGREAWVRGLKNEHRYLRQYLAELDEANARRKFLRLLDGHDEKEERVVYPDILAHLGAQAEALLSQVKAFLISTETIQT